jgi:hypothetical protein
VRLGNDHAWNACVATSPGRPSPTNACLWITAARYKQPFRDGSTHVVLEPLDFIARLTALVPRPKLNLTHFHGVFAPNCKHRTRSVPYRTAPSAA